MAILPSPLGSNAKPMRGAGLKKCPFRQPAFEEEPTVAAGKAAKTDAGIVEVPPDPPHWTMPLNGLPTPATKDPFTGSARLAVFENTAGEPPATNALGSRLKACL